MEEIQLMTLQKNPIDKHKAKFNCQFKNLMLQSRVLKFSHQQEKRFTWGSNINETSNN